MSRAAWAEVSLVAPGQRGCEAIAILPPGRILARNSLSRASRSWPKPIELTARIASTGWFQLGQFLDRAQPKIDATGLNARCVASASRSGP